MALQCKLNIGCGCHHRDKIVCAKRQLLIWWCDRSQEILLDQHKQEKHNKQNAHSTEEQMKSVKSWSAVEHIADIRIKKRYQPVYQNIIE